MEQQTLFSKTPLTHKTDFMPARERKDLERSALSQEARILAFFALRAPKGFTACEVWKDAGLIEPLTLLREDIKRLADVPLTSIRRAITNLADDGFLFKSNETRTGIYGKQAHVYYFVKKR